MTSCRFLLLAQVYIGSDKHQPSYASAPSSSPVRSQCPPQFQCAFWLERRLSHCSRTGSEAKRQAPSDGGALTQRRVGHETHGARPYRVPQHEVYSSVCTHRRVCHYFICTTPEVPCAPSGPGCPTTACVILTTTTY